MISHEQAYTCIGHTGSNTIMTKGGIGRSPQTYSED